MGDSALIPHCQARNAKGGTCGAPPTNGSQYCFWHDPTRKEEQRLAAAKGGLTSRPRPLPLDTADPRLRSPGDIARIAEELCGAVLRGQLSANVLCFSNLTVCIVFLFLIFLYLTHHR